MTPQEVIADTLAGELRLILSLAGVTIGVAGKQAVNDADEMITDLTRVVLDALHANGHVVIQLPGPDDGDHEGAD